MRNSIVQVHPLPSDAHRWNRALRGAFLKGQRARAAGDQLTDCPYADIRKLDGRLTWSRSFERAWVDGWKYQNSQQEMSMQSINAKLPAIRFIVATVTQAPDRYGNSSRWARITSTVTGRSLVVLNVGGPENVSHSVSNALNSQRPVNFDVWSWVNSMEREVPRKRFTQPSAGVYESDLTADLILELEQPAN